MILKDSPFTEFMHLLFAKIPGIPSSPPDISLSRLSQEVNSRKGLFKCWVHLTWVAPSIWIEEDRSLAFFTKKVNYLNICCLKATEGQGKQLQLIRRGVCRSPAGQAAKGISPHHPLSVLSCSVKSHPRVLRLQRCWKLKLCLWSF